MAPSNPPARLLVVDDEEHNRDMLSRRLRRRGYEVAVACSGEDALGLLASESFDIVILDLMMPEMDGFEVLRRVRAQTSKLELPVIMATACADSKEIVEALQLGANDYVTKPIEHAQLCARIESQLTLHREFIAMRREARAPVQSTDRLAPGTVLDGRYEIEARVGQGGYALVYRARQLSTGQPVAIKILRALRALSSGVEGVEYARFRREMQLLGTLRHPAIVRLIDSGSLTLERGALMFSSSAMTMGEATISDAPSLHDTSPGAEELVPEVPYYVMEYLEGETLESLLARAGRLPLDHTLELLFPILDGIHALHRRGVVHRDLKPANIFLQRAEHRGFMPKVLDFGIAKQLDGSGANQDTVGFVGTPSYMSPEQALGKGPLDGRADQYTLALIAYECLCGERPFIGDNYTQVLLEITTGEFVPLRQRCEVPPSLCEAISRAMSRDPAARFEDLEHFRRALVAAAPAQLRPRFEARSSSL